MQQGIAVLRKQRRRRFVAKGVAFAVASGVCYGLYTAFLTLAETQGVWGSWLGGSEWGGGSPLSAFSVTFALAALAAGINDLISGIWSLRDASRTGSWAICAKPCAPNPAG